MWKKNNAEITQGNLKNSNNNDDEEEEGGILFYQL